MIIKRNMINTKIVIPPTSSDRNPAARRRKVDFFMAEPLILDWQAPPIDRFSTTSLIGLGGQMRQEKGRR
jgi:hypothetical protein